MKRLFVFAVILFAVVAINGCGSPTAAPSDGTPTTPTTPTDPAVAAVAAIDLTANTATIPTSGTTTLNVSLLNASGGFVTDSKTVIFTLSAPSLASITPTATTSSGTINQVLTAKTLEGTVTVTATVDGKSDTQVIQISNLAAAATVTATANPTPITVGGTSVVSATVLDSGGNPMVSGTTVNFSVNNTSIGTIVPSASISGTAGVAQATFTAGMTSPGTATITATSGGISGTTTIEVLGTTAQSIEFVSAEPQTVVIAGSGGVETSLVRFLVKSADGTPFLESATVRFNLSGPGGGEYLGATSGVTTLDVGTSGGYASTYLHSGIIPGTVTITASIVGTLPLLTSSSGVIAIGGGIPSAGHFSLSATKLNLDGFDFDGLTSTITARIADRYGNYNVLEGTSVSFYSECGAIDRSVNLSATGVGSVEFRTQLPNPVNHNGVNPTIAADYFTKLRVTLDASNHPGNGVCTIVAVIDGEEEFTDSNASGTYNIGETYTDTYDDVHLDMDDDPVNIPPAAVVAGYPYDPGFEDLIVDRDKDTNFDGMNGVWDSNKRISNRINILYTGDSERLAIPGIHVAIDSDSNDATAQVPVVEGVTMVTVPNGGNTRVYFSIHDAYFNPPIAGSTFKVTSEKGVLTGRDQWTYLDTSIPGAPIYFVTITDTDAGDGLPPEVGILKFEWTWKGQTYTFSTPVSVD